MYWSSLVKSRAVVVLCADQSYAFASVVANDHRVFATVEERNSAY